MRAIRLLPALVALWTLASAATAAEPPRITCRVLGLFGPDRVADLREAFDQLPDLSLVAIDFDDAEITVQYVPGPEFPASEPDKVLERINQKLEGSTRRTFGVRPRRTLPRERLQRVVIPVSGLDCKGCCLAAYDAISPIDGVFQATVSFREGRITALIDPKQTDQAKLEEALRKKRVDVGKP